MTPDCRFFASPQEWRRWLDRHHTSAAELWVGFYKVRSGRPSITWPESVDEALCVGWIDGIRRTIDEHSYAIRFTPRRPRSSWSLVNVRRVAALTRAGRMSPAGLAAYGRRSEHKTGIYNFERRRRARLSPAFAARLRANAAAWEFFRRQAPWYRGTATAWVMSAKKMETRERRLEQLVADSAQGRTIRPLTRTP